MLFLVYLTALETIIKENKKAVDHSKSVRENLIKIKFEMNKEVRNLNEKTKFFVFNESTF